MDRPCSTISTSTTKASSTTASGWSMTSRPATSKLRAEFSSTTQKTTSVLRTLLTTGTSGKEETGNTTQTFIWKHADGSEIQIHKYKYWYIWEGGDWQYNTNIYLETC